MNWWSNFKSVWPPSPLFSDVTNHNAIVGLSIVVCMDGGYKSKPLVKTWVNVYKTIWAASTDFIIIGLRLALLLKKQTVIYCLTNIVWVTIQLVWPCWIGMLPLPRCSIWFSSKLKRLKNYHLSRIIHFKYNFHIWSPTRP